MPKSETYIHVLARAVIRIDDELLLARCKGASNTFLPGGHVEVGESMHDAIARELNEEFGRSCVVGGYLGAIEHAFTESGSTQHEVSHFFRVQLVGIDGPQPLDSLEPHLEFFWQPITKLGDTNLQPSPAIALVTESCLTWGSTLKHGA
ncbi:MAG: NUDIX domain-containing protein [Planctomycetota bacterium]